MRLASPEFSPREPIMCQPRSLDDVQSAFSSPMMQMTRLIGGMIMCISGCGKTAVPTDEKAPPATVKWEGPVQGALEEWTELFGTTIPVADRAARVTAPVEGRVQAVFSDAG